MTFYESLVFWAITGILTVGMGFLRVECRRLYKARDLENKKYLAINDGVRAILRDRILQTHNHYTEKGWAPFYALQNMDNMYKAYHDIGGNGAITEIYHKFMQLPQYQEEKSEK